MMGKLTQKAEGLTSALTQIDCLTKEIQLKDVTIKQLSRSSTSGANEADALESMQAENARLKQDNKALHESQEHWKNEADSARARYENYSKQMSQQFAEMSREVEAANFRRAEYEAKLGDLEKKYETLKAEKVQVAAPQTAATSKTEPSEELRKMQERITFLSADKEMLLMQHRTKDEEITRLNRSLTEQRSQLRHLQEQKDHRSSLELDRESLLTAIQSEKVTASRAVEQNRQLKQQLVEMEDQFVKMANDNMEKTTKLQSMEHTCQTAEARFAQYETELETARLQADETSRGLLEEIHQLRKEVTEAAQEGAVAGLQQPLAAVVADAVHQTDAVDVQDHPPPDPAELDSLRTQLTQVNASLAVEASENKHKDAKIDELESAVASLRQGSGEVDRLSAELTRLRTELSETQSRLTVLSRENTELHQIMDQNSEDENQNSIRVELQDALDRVTQLSTENAELRQQVEELQSAAQRSAEPLDFGPSVHQHSTNESRPSSLSTAEQQLDNQFAAPQVEDRGVDAPEMVSSSSSHRASPDHSVCSEHMEQSRLAVSAEASENLKSAMDLLQLKPSGQSVCSEHMEQSRLAVSAEASENLKSAMDRLQLKPSGQSVCSEHMEQSRLAVSAEASENLKSAMDLLQLKPSGQSVCSEHMEQSRLAVSAEASENLKSAMDLLQKRFTRAMNENANLSDQNQQLEHAILNLQSETDTIGEYITLYQHQRKVIRERLKQKDEYIAQLSREKERVNSKLSELQDLMLAVFRETGLARQYHATPPTRAPPVKGAHTSVPPRPQRLSQTLVDEETGETVAASDAPTNADSPNESEGYESDRDPSGAVSASTDSTIPNGDASSSHVEAQPVASSTSPVVSSSSPVMSSTSPVMSSSSPMMSSSSNENAELLSIAIPPGRITRTSNTDAILRLINELQRPDTPVTPTDRNLHCRYCTGKLEVI